MNAVIGHNPTHLSVALLADYLHPAAPDLYAARLVTISKDKPDYAFGVDKSAPDQWEKDALVASLHGHDIAIASFGVPRAGEYQQKVDALLDAWKETPNKPVLLIATQDNDKTSAAVNHWMDRQDDIQLPLALRRAILVDRSESLMGVENLRTELDSAIQAVSDTVSARKSPEPEETVNGSKFETHKGNSLQPFQ